MVELRFLVPVRLADLAARHGGVVDEAARELVVERVRSLEDDKAGDGDLAPLTSSRHMALARLTRSILLTDAPLAAGCPAGRRWIHPHASWALAGILTELAPAEEEPVPRGHAFVAPTARLHPSVRLEPGAVVLGDAVIDADTVIGPHAVVYGRVRLGARVSVGASAVIGRPGFGWATGPEGALRRIPQLGGVIVEDDVEVGPLATVDAGTLAPTILKRGVRLDAHVHVGHNVEIGAGTLVAAQSGFAGSVIVEEGVRIGGQAGVADHVRIGRGARIAAKAGVIGDVPPGVVVAGYPAVERGRWLRGIARMLRRPGRLK